MLEYMKALRHAEIVRNVNYKYIPCTAFAINDEGAASFNKIYHWCLSEKMNKIVRAPAGGISYAGKNFRPPMWDVRVLTTMVELTIVRLEGMWRIQFRPEATTEEKGIYGSKAFNEFKKTCEKYGIDIESMAIDNGKEVKKEIESPMIDAVDIEFHKIYRRVHHIDFNSSHISGMVEAFPELRPPFEEIYNKRKENEGYKAILTHTWGYFQSMIIKARFAHISKEGIAYTNRRMREMSEKLEKSGRRVLLYNTDGIWYQGEIYHDEGEGRQLGQWKNDHVNCMFRAASKGKYEYIDEEGDYHPVVRGRTHLDKIKARKDWEWGDIYDMNAREIEYTWTEEGITKEGVLL